MTIEPFIKCSDIQVSLDFYTRILDFTIVKQPDPDPEAFLSRYALIRRDADLLHLSSHANDGAFGNVVYVGVEEVDRLFNHFLERGLIDDGGRSKPGVRIRPVDQSWGMREFSVSDPDGNKLTFGCSIA